MKCIKCGASVRLRERNHGRCPKCRHLFAFDPRTDLHRFTDAEFKNAVDRVSGGNGKVRFTDRHLWYEMDRRWRSSGVLHRAYTVVPDALWGALPGAALAYALSIPALYWLAPVGALAAAGTGAYHTWRDNRRPPSPMGEPRTRFEYFQKEVLARWVQVNGRWGLLPPREEALATMPKKVPADVATFSFDRAVVTDRWETAQMLVANRFHFEHNCAVLSVDGYPDGIADTVKKMLRRNPRLTVFALHDASPDGCHLPLVLREPEWFPDPRVRIVDLGLRPEMVKRLRLFVLRGPAVLRPPRLTKMLTADELTWLAHGNIGELAALRPAELMRAVYRGIVAAGPHDGSAGAPESAGASYGGGVIWIGNLGGGADTAAVDGFG
jgi:DNA-directed RNA polymerase subunit RPC12/RpoP